MPQFTPTPAPDNFDANQSPELEGYQHWLSAFMQKESRRWHEFVNRELAPLTPQEQLLLLRACCLRIRHLAPFAKDLEKGWHAYYRSIQKLKDHLFNSNLPFQTEDKLFLLEQISQYAQQQQLLQSDFQQYLRPIEEDAIEDSIKQQLQLLLQELTEHAQLHEGFERLAYFKISRLTGDFNPLLKMREDYFPYFGQGQPIGSDTLTRYESWLIEFPYFDEDPLLEAHQYIGKTLDELYASRRRSFYNVDEDQYPLFRDLTKLPPPLQIMIAKAVWVRMAWYAICLMDIPKRAMGSIIDKVFRKKLPFQEADFIWISTQIPRFIHGTREFPFPHFLKHALAHLKKNQPSHEMLQAMRELQACKATENGSPAEVSKIKQLLQEILQMGKGQEGVWLHEEDAFGQEFNQFIKSLPEKEVQQQWFALLREAMSSNGSKPSAKKQQTLQSLVQSIGYQAFSDAFANHLPLLYQKKDLRDMDWKKWDKLKFNQPFVKGLLWASAGSSDSTFLSALASFAERCYQTVPNYGPLAVGIGNAALYALSQAEGLSGVSQLSQLRGKVRQSNTRKAIGKYIEQAAQNLGISTYEIEDMSIPNYGMVQGEIREKMGEYTAQLSIQSIGKSALIWLRADGKPQKSVPASIKAEYADNIKQLKKLGKEALKTLSSQRDRLDRGYIHNRSWSYEQFEKHLLRHGLMSILAHQLIWTFTWENREQAAGIYNGSGFEDAQGKELKGDLSRASIRLWHPIDASVEEVLSWRNYLNEKQLQQPIKQAYREVYIVTEAELGTETYSNRFASHILRQHQFNSLAKLRGWTYTLMGAYDDGIQNTTANIELPAHRLRASFWIDEVDADGAFSDSGIWDYVSTDQMRFQDPEGNLVAVSEVPAIAFSEIMRDADMFVGVGSIGNDPNWQDQGAERHLNTYWQHYSFGDLSETANTRKEVLETLIPKLGIAKQCHIEQKFLVVKGKLRIYKIHLGSGNILMEPNDQYLCIVPDRSIKHKQQKVFLPFEGDQMLSIILSKAFLLAKDDQINDSSIMRQING